MLNEVLLMVCQLVACVDVDGPRPWTVHEAHAITSTSECASMDSDSLWVRWLAVGLSHGDRDGNLLCRAAELVSIPAPTGSRCDAMLDWLDEARTWPPANAYRETIRAEAEYRCALEGRRAMRLVERVDGP